MDSPHLSSQLAIYREIRDRLSAIYSLDQDDEAITTSALGETNLEEAIADLLRRSVEAKAYAEAVKSIIEANQARKARHEQRADSLRSLAAWAMAEANLPKLPMPDLTASLREGRPKLIVNEGSLAAKFLQKIVTQKPDMAAIQAAVEAGDVPEGVEISNGAPVLTVRIR